jgi:transcriptional regulator GlxA family with amidase domain
MSPATDSLHRPPPTTSHRRIVAHAEAYVRAHLDSPVPVSRLCRLVGRSERTLREAFRDVHGMGPKRWEVGERLKAVRRVLTRPGQPPTTVTLAATAHGFYDLGRFAAMYRETFGEAPSETLRGPVGVFDGPTQRMDAHV